MSDEKSDDDIYKVDTVPPPAGEDDAYSAPTRIGPMAAAVVEEIMVASVRRAAERSERAIEKAAAEKAVAKAMPEPEPETALDDSDLIAEPAPAFPPPLPSSKAPAASAPPAASAIPASARSANGGWSPPPIIPMPQALQVPRRSDASLYIACAIGFAIFAIGLVVFFWFR